MGMNLRSCCHLCKEKIYHFRNEEQKTLLPFYYKHYACMRKDPKNIETKEDQLQEEWWMAREEEGGYKEIELLPNNGMNATKPATSNFEQQ